MKTEVILVFDIGKTNKKVLLFDRGLRVILEEEIRFKEVIDDEGFPCDDAELLESWILETYTSLMNDERFEVKGLNITAYGATLVFLDEDGNRITPIYNYLKPLPGEVLEGFYEQYGGKEEFCRNTASPALGMLNSGLQILWLKRTKPEVFNSVGHILHLPQFLSFLITKEITTESTSIGCHTALWDFDTMRYHPWLKDEGIVLQDPEQVDKISSVQWNNKIVKAGVGIHDSSASLVPYLLADEDPFILVSTGTWCINMNPFNHAPLAAPELNQDCLCFLSVKGLPVKASRFFMGHIHDVNVKRIESHFQADPGSYKRLQPDRARIRSLWDQKPGEALFFKDQIPDDYLDRDGDLDSFSGFEDAYARFMKDLTIRALRSIELVISPGEATSRIYISGGFAKNPYFTGFLACAFPGRKVCTSQVDNATSLGAAMIIAGKVWGTTAMKPDLGLREVR